MIILKRVIHDKKTNSVEATWVDVITPAIEVPESAAPDTMDKDGNIIPGEVTPAHTIDAVETQVKCHSYADVQMQMLKDDITQLGGNISEHQALIDEVTAAIVPYVPPVLTLEQIKEIEIRDGLESSVSGDSIIKSLKGMTAAEFDTWWAANITNAAQAINLLKRLVKVLLLRVIR